jgi:hexosaminidase
MQMTALSFLIVLPLLGLGVIWIAVIGNPFFFRTKRTYFIVNRKTENEDVMETKLTKILSKDSGYHELGMGLTVMVKAVLVLLGLNLLVACSDREHGSNSIETEQAGLSSEQSYQLFAEKLILTYQVVDNLEASDCKTLLKSGLCFDARINLSLDEKLILGEWRIYFSNMSPILSDSSDMFNIKRVNGDLHYIEPTEGFSGWSGNASFSIDFKAEFWHISEFDSPPNFYVVGNGVSAKVIRSTMSQLDVVTGQEIVPHMVSFVDSEKQFRRNKKDLSQWATAEQLYENNQQYGNQKVDSIYRIIPKPTKITINPTEEILDLTEGVFLNDNDFSITSTNPAVARLKRLGISVNENQGVPIIINKVDNIEIGTNQLESYRLTVATDKITIEASTESGAFYGLQSISALLNPNNQYLPLLEVEDAPRYEFRGLFIDVARNFRDKQFIVKMLDQMAAYKLNKLHLHLGDDEGWRLEIPGLPELTQLGAQRCHDLEETSCLQPQLGSGPTLDNANNGHYSIDDYQDILKQANARHIQVIPSFDMPGHSRAAVKSMLLRYRQLTALGKKELAEEFLLTDLNDKTKYSSVQFYNDNTLNVCQESTYRFVEKVLGELMRVHQLAETPLKTYHIGADETAGAWSDSPKCAVFVKDKGIEIQQLNQYFIHRVSQFLDSKGVQVGGWSDGLGETKKSEMPKNVHVNIWKPLYWGGHSVAHEMANSDWDVVLSLPDVTYFDFPYEADPKERGYYWGSRFTNTRQVFEWMPDNLPVHAEIWNDRINHPMIIDDRELTKTDKRDANQPLNKTASFKGIQAQLWGEMVRTDEIAEYMLFPRILAIAERAWHRADWEPTYDYSGKQYSRQSHHFSEEKIQRRNQDWSEFASAVSDKEMLKLDIDHVFYRLPTIGGINQAGKLKLNSIFPGLKLQYQLGEQPWKDYSKEQALELSNEKKIRIRSVNQSGSRKGRYLEILNSEID